MCKFPEGGANRGEFPVVNAFAKSRLNVSAVGANVTPMPCFCLAASDISP